MDELDDIIKKGLSTENPKSDFSRGVMDQILAVERKEDLAIKALFRKHILEHPSDTFTENVMNSVHTKVYGYKPIISKKTWVVISAIAGFLLGWTLISGDNNPSTIGLNFQKIMEQYNANQLNYFIESLFSSKLFALAMFASSLLMALDYFLRSKKIV
jgi:hypothetical protein